MTDTKGLLAGLSILLVDDRMLGIDNILRRLGAHVVISATLEAARKQLLGDQFQVALIDQHLGMEDGIQLAVWLHEHQPDVLRISLSGNRNVADEIKCILPPEKADLYATYLVKSIGPLQIGREIARIMAQRSGADTLAASTT